MKARPVEERFWEKVVKGAPFDCWAWTGVIGTHGYARLTVGSKTDASMRLRPAGQVAWEIRHEQPFPKHLSACHTCDNPGCVNPAHIFPGSQSLNARDMVAKNRMTKLLPKTHCKQGHEYVEGSYQIYYNQSGNPWKQCRVCERIKAKNYYWNKIARLKEELVHDNQ